MPKRRQKHVKNLTSEWNQKKHHSFRHASRSLLSIWFFDEGDPHDLFLPRPGSDPDLAETP